MPFPSGGGGMQYSSPANPLLRLQGSGSLPGHGFAADATLSLLHSVEPGACASVGTSLVATAEGFGLCGALGRGEESDEHAAPRRAQAPPMHIARREIIYGFPFGPTPFRGGEYWGGGT